VKFAVVVFAGVLLGTEPQLLHSQEKRPWDVGRICGRVEYVQRIPVRNTTNTFNEKRKALRGVALHLYNWQEGTPCCGDLAPVDSTISGKSGKFDFKQEAPSRYWLGTRWSGREYRVALVYRPKKDSQTMCSQQGIDLDDDGDMDWWETVTVD
jgi:hypothetical protein